MKKNRKNKERLKPNLLKDLSRLSLDEITGLQKSIPIILQSKVQQMSSSDDLEEIMKANLYLNSRNGSSEDKIRSIFFDPDFTSEQGRGYKDPWNSLSFETLRKMGDVFIIRSVVNTRVEQVQNFLHFNTDEQKEGYTIRRKQSLFERDSTHKEIEKKDQKKIETIVNFLENGGLADKWDNFDTFQDFGRKIVFDSLTLDQLAFEITRDRGWNLSKFRAVDASLIRLLDSADPRFAEDFEKYRFKGYLPRFCMSWQGQILQNPVTKESIVYYPWELGYGIRNKSTNIYKNGYGTSELETLVEIITWILWGLQYNGNFFSKGSQPKGFINIKNSNIDNKTLNEFRQAWTQTMRGVGNSHRTPVLQGLDLEWIDLQKTNRDMEFTEWVKFLIVITCSVYRIDPSELGFQFKDQAQIFGQDGQHERLNHSRDKGLKPLLVFIQNIINHYIVSELFDGEFEFCFTGIEIEDESKQVDLDKTKLEAGVVSMEDMFMKYSGRKFDPDKDTILNSVYQSAKQNEMNAQMYSQPMPGEVGGEVEDPYTSYEKSIGTDPIQDAAINYIKENLYK